MQTILLILKQPDGKRRAEVDAWNETMHDIRSAIPTEQHSPGIEEPTEGVFCIRSSSGLRSFATALLRAEQRHIPYRVMFVEAGTEWSHQPKAS